MKNIISSFTLPNGSVLKNRIAKSAMSENFGTRNHAPSKGLINTYKVWAKGNPGLLITGNIMVDSRGGFTEKESMEVIRLLLFNSAILVFKYEKLMRGTSSSFKSDT